MTLALRRLSATRSVDEEDVHLVLGILIAIGVVFAAGLLSVIAILGVRRSRRKHGSSGALGAGMLETQSLLEPSKRHVLGATRRKSEFADEDSSGEPPR